MQNPAWDLDSKPRADLPHRMNTGRSGENVHQSFDEFQRRLDEEQAAAAVAEAPAATPAAAGSGPAALPEAPPADLPPDRFHKWGHYVIVAKDHRPGDDPIIPPGYRSPTAAASSIDDAYTKAKEIASQDGVRCPLIIMGGGGPWVENINLDSNAVDWEGWGNPVIQGNLNHVPHVDNFVAKDITFLTINTQPAYHLPFGPPQYYVQPVVGSLTPGIQFLGCNFAGPAVAFLAQRTFYARGCRYWGTSAQPIGALANRVAPCWVEQEDTQTWFTFFRQCEFYAYRTFKDGGALPAPLPYGTKLTAPGYAIRALARRDGHGILPNMRSYDGVYRSAVNAVTGLGSVQSGLILDDCYVEGSLDCDSWFVAHTHGRQVGGLPIVTDFGTVYATVRGFDWMDAGTNFIGRQFGVVMFDNTLTHASVIAQGEAQPDVISPAFKGGVGIHFRNSQHPVKGTGFGGAATQNIGTTAMYFHQVESNSGAANWRGAGVIGSDYGGIVNVPAGVMYHSLYSE